MVSIRAVKRSLVVLAVVLGAAGCSGSQPAASPTTLPPVTSAAPGPSPTPAVPVVKKPKLADEPTAAGAEAFARYWIEVVNSAYDSVDPSGIEAISAKSCMTCRAYINSLKKASYEERRYRGGKIIIKEVVAPAVQGATATVLLNYDVPPLEVLSRDGTVLRTVKAEKNIALRFDLKRLGSSWIAREVGQV